MKLNFCTLFNSAYLSRGLNMYASLQKHCDNFHLYVFAFDTIAFEYLSDQNYPNLTVISLAQFEDSELLRIKPSRTAGEYCWTCTSSTLLYCLQKFFLDQCTYLDADLFFYSDPRVLINEMGDNSVLITEHRYTPLYDQSSTSGIYCVQFITFKNTSDGLAVLNWWRNACIDWCYNRHENGKFGDQKYLDDWTRRFKGIHVLENLGGGLAPWNVQQYKFTAERDKIVGIEKSSNKKFEVIFYHFHDLKFYTSNYVEFTGAGYIINSTTASLFYKSYLQSWVEIKKEIHLRAKRPFDADATSKKILPSKLGIALNNFLSNIRLIKNAVRYRNLTFRWNYNHFREIDSFLR